MIIQSLDSRLSNKKIRSYVAWFYYFWFENVLFNHLDYSTVTKLPKSLLKVLEKPLETLELEIDGWFSRSKSPIFHKMNIISGKFFQQILSDRIWDEVEGLKEKMIRPTGFGVKEKPLKMFSKFEKIRRLMRKYYLLGPTQKRKRGFSA